jgi:hypothetical protein
VTNLVDDAYVEAALRRGETLSTEFKGVELAPLPGQSWNDGIRRNQEREFIKDVGALANVVEGPNTPALVVIGVDRTGNPAPHGPVFDRAAMSRLAREEFEYPIELRYTEHHAATPGGTRARLVVAQVLADAGNRPYRVKATFSFEHAGKAFGRRYKVGRMPLEPEAYVLNSGECSLLQEAAAAAREPGAWALAGLTEDDLVADHVEIVLSGYNVPTDRFNAEHRRRRVQRYGLLTPEGVPTYVAALFCCEPPLPTALTGAEILLVVHSPGSDHPAPRRFHGVLPEQIRAAFDAFKRETGPHAPDEAVREILVNAVIHRDYRRAEPVRVNLYPGRCVIESPGGLIPPITVQHLTGPRFYDRHPPHRNAVLVRTFLAVQRQYFADSAFEGIGSGIPEAYEVARRFGAEPPLSATADERSVVVTVHGRFMPSDTPAGASDDPGDLLGYLRRHGSAPFAELALAFSHIPPTRLRQMLRDLRQAGEIRQSGAGRSVTYEAD